MKKVYIISILFLTISIISGCSHNKENTMNTNTNSGGVATLIISAATSLSDVMQEIKTMYEQRSSVQLTFNFGSSGTLAQQIEQGAPVDLFISANHPWMDNLEVKDIIIDHSRVNIAGNHIVMITNQTSNISYDSFSGITKNTPYQLAIGNPDSVPAGKYTKQIFEHNDLWEDLQGKFVLAKNVRQVLTYIETGNIDIGFVYESDVYVSDQVKILAKANEAFHDPITYPAAIIANSQQIQETKKFLSFLQTEEVKEVFKKYGFSK